MPNVNLRVLSTRKHKLVNSIETALHTLRAAGYLIVAWSPEELSNVDTGALEDYLIAKGNDYIEDSLL